MLRGVVPYATASVTSEVRSLERPEIPASSSRALPLHSHCNVPKRWEISVALKTEPIVTLIVRDVSRRLGPLLASRWDPGKDHSGATCVALTKMKYCGIRRGCSLLTSWPLCLASLLWGLVFVQWLSKYIYLGRDQKYLHVRILALVPS